MAKSHVLNNSFLIEAASKKTEATVPAHSFFYWINCQKKKGFVTYQSNL